MRKQREVIVCDLCGEESDGAIVSRGKDICDWCATLISEAVGHKNRKTRPITWNLEPTGEIKAIQAFIDGQLVGSVFPLLTTYPWRWLEHGPEGKSGFSPDQESAMKALEDALRESWRLAGELK